MNAVQAVSFGKINLRNVRKDKPGDYGYDGEWDWEKGFQLFIKKSDANSSLTANDRSLVHWSGVPEVFSIFIKRDDRSGVTDSIKFAGHMITTLNSNGKKL